MGILTRATDKLKTKIMKNTTTIKGTEVELQWGEGQGLGTAAHTVPSDRVSDCVISDGETFELRGKKYTLGQHDYSTDQPGSEDDAECTCTAAIYEVE